jgi:hypothetical protein
MQKQDDDVAAFLATSYLSSSVGLNSRHIEYSNNDKYNDDEKQIFNYNASSTTNTYHSQ